MSNDKLEKRLYVESITFCAFLLMPGPLYKHYSDALRAIHLLMSSAFGFRDVLPQSGDFIMCTARRVSSYSTS